jgi:hypothetical protein
MSTCPPPAVLMAFGEGVLTGALCDDVRRHLEQCRVCRLLIEDLGRAGNWEGDAQSVRRVWSRIESARAQGEQRRSRWLWTMIPAIGTAAMLLLLLPTLPTPLPPLHRAIMAAPVWNLAAMARVEPAPVHIGIESVLLWRGGHPASELVQALTLYRNADYVRAVPALRAVKQRHAEAKVPLAVSLLMSGRDDAAYEELAGETSEEARWYRAQAALRLERFASARDELQAVCQGSGTHATAACALSRELLLPSHIRYSDPHSDKR